MICWLNVNQGAVMAVLTLVYVLATIAIVLVTVCNQRKNTKMGLFDKRFEVYAILMKWCATTENVFSDSIKDITTGELLSPIKVFEQCVYGRHSIISEIGSTDARLKVMLTQPAAQVPENAEEIRKLQTAHDEQKGKIFADMWQAYANICAEGNKLATIELLFSSVDFNKVKKFTDAAVALSGDLTVENLNELKTAFKQLEHEKLLRNMKSQLDLSEYSFKSIFQRIFGKSKSN